MEHIAHDAPLSVAVSNQVVRAAASRTEAEFWEFQAPLIAMVF